MLNFAAIKLDSEACKRIFVFKDLGSLQGRERKKGHPCCLSMATTLQGKVNLGKKDQSSAVYK